MGPLAVLIVLGVTYLLAAVLSGIALGSIFRLASSGVESIERETLVSEAQYFPLSLIPYLAFALSAYIVSCVYIRDVDVPIGDSWEIHIDTVATIGMVDTMEIGNLYFRGDSQPSVQGIKSYANAANAIYGSLKSGDYFVYELNSHQPRIFGDELSYLSAIGNLFSSRNEEKSLAEHYKRSRIAGDLASFALLAIYPLWKLSKLGARLIVIRRDKNAG